MYPRSDSSSNDLCPPGGLMCVGPLPTRRSTRRDGAAGAPVGEGGGRQRSDPPGSCAYTGDGSTVGVLSVNTRRKTTERYQRRRAGWPDIPVIVGCFPCP